MKRSRIDSPALPAARSSRILARATRPEDRVDRCGRGRLGRALRALLGRGSAPAFERRARRQTERARAHLERQRRRGRVLAVEDARERGQRRRRIRRLRPAACGLCGLAAGLFSGPHALEVGLEYLEGAPAQVASVSISGNSRLSTRDVALATGVTPGSPLASVDARAVERALTSHRWIRSARATALPNGTLLVEVEERQPLAIVRSGSEQRWQLVDASAVPFAPADPELARDLPRFHSSPALASGQRHEVLARALALAGQLSRKTLSKLAGTPPPPSGAGWPRGVELQLPSPSSPEGWILHSAHPPSAVILGLEGLERRVAQLAQLLGSDLREVRGAETIDLRFADRAVLRTASASGRGGHQAAAPRRSAKRSRAGRTGDPPLRSKGGEKHGA